MAYTTINKSTDYFNTKLYTGDGSSSHAITGVGFAPDFVWSKARNGANAHILVDKVRGATKVLHSSATTAEQTCNANQDMISLDSDGFTVGTPTQFLGTNTNGRTVASWNWKANGQGSANTDGSINTTYTSVNTTAGFSISTWTGTGANATVGHGLGTKPEMIIVKNYSAAQNWCVYHSGLGGTEGHKAIYLDLNYNEVDQTGFWNDTAATSSVFSVGTNTNTNGSGASMIAYCFAPKTGYSKFGSFTGNGNADGSFIYTGFSPSFVMTKNSSINDWWGLWDNKRLGFNSSDSPRLLFPDATSAESTSKMLDFTSNGFKIRDSNGAINGSGNTVIYMAFGQSIVGSNNVPAVAR